MDELGVEYNNPKSLYCYCIEYVSSNLLLIESLIGFPELIGREIFQAAVDLNEDSTSFSFQTFSGRKSLQLFFDAYGGGDILPSLSLCEDHVFFNDIIDDCWWIFEHLVHLDISSCGIGDGHDFIVVMDRMLRLQTLSLRHNAVTDEGVRRLTVKSRMSQTSSLVLKSLDISGNSGITVKSVNFLRYLQSLALLNVSETGVNFKDTILLNDWEALTEHEDKCDCVTSHFLVKTVGWAADVLENLKLECHLPNRTSLTVKKSTESSSVLGITGQTFYSRPGVRTSIKSSSSKSATTSHSSTHESKKKNSSLILISNTFFCDHIQPKKHVLHQKDTNHKTCASSQIQRAAINRGSLQTSGANGVRKRGDTHNLNTREMFADCDLKESVLSHYTSSPPPKKLKRVSVLQLLDDSF